MSAEGWRGVRYALERMHAVGKAAPHLALPKLKHRSHMDTSSSTGSLPDLDIQAE
jgi:hypothetical protein